MKFIIEIHLINETRSVKSVLEDIHGMLDYGSIIYNLAFFRQVHLGNFDNYEVKEKMK